MTIADQEKEEILVAVQSANSDQKEMLSSCVGRPVDASPVDLIFTTKPNISSSN